ncbi:cyclin-A1-4 [Impatiens glandulifera]|uniref:cyclin-A1-4 n=1 Tax=Impatiens glandulifera TaxID=253017 RepID=UPI001FB0AB0E|nr:cyclin-A1-4 [Impatiens glandulifera]
MSMHSRRSSSITVPSSSSLSKRQASSSDNPGKIPSAANQDMAKKQRAALADMTNQRNASRNGGRTFSGSSVTAVCPIKTANSKKIISSSSAKLGNVERKPTLAVSVTRNSTPFTRSGDELVVPLKSVNMDISPSHSEGSVSLDETMSTCDSLKSPDIEYLDNDSHDSSLIDSIERKTCNKLHISDDMEISGNQYKKEDDDKVADIDNDFIDPQLCATLACDIYKHLRASEMKKRPTTDFMEKVQKDVNASMRGILIDWLIEVSEEYRLVPDTLYLTINYIDRYLSGNVMDRHRLQLLGVSCMMIAAKYEEISAPQVEEFCYITDNTYFKDEVLQMESSVLNYLKFEMTAPTIKCFLRRFVRVSLSVDEAASMQFECLANYLAELSLIEYNMLCYAPSLIAASAIFLARYMFNPSKRPWNTTLRHYTLYQPIDLHECVKALHRLCNGSNSSSLPAVREKYSQHKYKFVAKKYCPPSIPEEYFQNVKVLNSS